MKYIVTIEETISKEYELEASDLENAIKIAIKKYDNGEFILEPGELSAKQISARDFENNLQTEWVNF